MVSDMLKKIFRQNSILQEYVGELKITYQTDVLEVVNYLELISIYEREVILSKICVLGSNLKVVYQDPVKVKIKGKITSVTERIENGI